jgi:hypothetical protein
MKFKSTLFAALAVSSAVVLTSGAASACNVVGKTKSGERRCSTTYVYKGPAKSWTNPNAWQKPAEKCRSTCLRDAMKWGSSAQQTAYFKMCTRNSGCQ